MNITLKLTFAGINIYAQEHQLYYCYNNFKGPLMICLFQPTKHVTMLAKVIIIRDLLHGFVGLQFVLT